MKALISAFFRFWDPKLRKKGSASALLIARCNNRPVPYAKSVLDKRDMFSYSIHISIMVSITEEIDMFLLAFALVVGALAISIVGGWFVATKLDSSRHIK